MIWGREIYFLKTKAVGFRDENDSSRLEIKLGTEERVILRLGMGIKEQKLIKEGQGDDSKN